MLNGKERETKQLWPVETAETFVFHFAIQKFKD
jgi:hypothetical protein